MENQHRQILGYREMTKNEIALMNTIQNMGKGIEGLCNMLTHRHDVEPRWVDIGIQHFQQGLMALTRAVAKPTTFLLLIFALSGCISPHKEASGTYIKTAHTEYRSLLGTNNSFAQLQRCDGPKKSVLFYLEGDFTNCQTLPLEESLAWQHGYSQGQGGQILSGAMNAGAVGAIAATTAGGNAAANAAVTITNTVAPKGRGRH